MSNREILMVALEVIAGLWGDGEEREQDLIYFYGRDAAVKVQDAVNRLVGAFQGYRVSYL